MASRHRWVDSEESGIARCACGVYRVCLGAGLAPMYAQTLESTPSSGAQTCQADRSSKREREAINVKLNRLARRVMRLTRKPFGVLDGLLIAQLGAEIGRWTEAELRAAADSDYGRIVHAELERRRRLEV